MTDAPVPMTDRLRRIRDCHFECYVDLALAADQARGEGDDWFDVVESEIANIRGAVEWGLLSERPETATLAASLLWYWRRSHRFTEAREVLDRALRHPNLPPASRIDALYAAGALAWDQRDRADARERYEAARRLAASVVDHRRQARAALGVAWACYHASLADPAVEAFSEAAELSGSLSEKADALRGLGWSKRLQGDTNAAVQLHLDARTLLEDAGDPDLTAHYLVEVNFLVEMGRPDEAFVLAEKSLAVARAGGGDLIFALIAREKAADALGDVELLRRAIDEGIQITQAAGQLSVDHPRGHVRVAAKWEAHFQGRLADHAILHGDIETARKALDRALHVFDGLGDLDSNEVDALAGCLARRGRLAEDDGDLALAEELHRQVELSSGGSSPHLHARALAALARLRAAHGDDGGGRLALSRALAVVDGLDEWTASDLWTELAVLNDELGEALRLATDAIEVYIGRGNRPLPVTYRRRATLLAELGRLDEAVAALDEAVATRPATSEAADRALSHLERARVRVELGDAAVARSDLLAAAAAAQIGWASDQLQLASTLARLALLEGRRDTADSLWTAVQEYRSVNKRVAPRLSQRFEEPLVELEVVTERPAGNSSDALDALRRLVAAEFEALVEQGGPARP